LAIDKKRLKLEHLQADYGALCNLLLEPLHYTKCLTLAGMRIGIVSDNSAIKIVGLADVTGMRLRSWS
jgi:hypothetical protein